MMRTIFAVAVFSMATLLAAEPGDAGKKEMEAMQGDWACESMVRDGMAIPGDDAQALFRTVKGNAYTVQRYRRRIGGGKFTVDTTKTPRQIDIFPDGATKDAVIRGIYKLEKDQLTMCYGAVNKDRPTEFAAKEGSGVTLVVWGREKK